MENGGKGGLLTGALAHFPKAGRRPSRQTRARGLGGGAWGTGLAPSVVLAVGSHGVLKVHRLVACPDAAMLRAGIGGHLAVAIPAVLTNIANPVANAYVTAALAPYGQAAALDPDQPG